MSDQQTDDDGSTGHPISRRTMLALLGSAAGGAALATGADNADEPGGLSAGGGVPLERLDVREWWVATDAADMETITLDERPAIVIVESGDREGAYLYA